jgi:predicted nucleotidyltransferase
VATSSIVMPKLGIVIPTMGTAAFSPQQTLPAPRGHSLADALFTGTQQRVLGLLFGQPERSFYATELIGLAGIGSGAVQRELARLVQSGLVTVRAIGNQRHYQANPTSPLFAELRGLVLKTVGLAEPLREALQPLAGQIQAAFVYGSVAKRQDTAASDIDLMVISDSLSYGDTFAALEAAGACLGRPVNPTILSQRDLARRVAEDSTFVARVLSQPKIWLIGGADVLGV